MKRVKKLKADVVVAGFGAAGHAAALTAAERGAKVIALEKMAVPGGTANFAEGLFAAESSLQKRQGIVVTRDQVFRLLMDYSHWRANPRVVRALVDKSPDTIEWLKGHGITFEYIGPGGPGGILTWHVLKGHAARMMKILRERYFALGGEVLLQTRLDGLLTDGGRVAGARAVGADGEALEISADRVVIATGGFINNREMLEKFVRYPGVAPVGNTGKEGEGIRAAWGAGAAQEGVEVIQSYRPGIAGLPPSSHLLGAARQPHLWVDPSGKRFCDEGIILLWPFAGNALEKIGGVMWSLYDSDTLAMFAEGAGIEVPMGEWITAGEKLTRLQRELKREVDSATGNVAVADTLAELAAKLGMEAAVLVATVEENNRAAQTRRDTLFAKNPDYLRPLAKPPFYATKLAPTALGTLGGIRVNERAQAVDAHGEPIPGLYAAGNDAGGLYGDSYELMVGGVTLGFAVNFGRIAGELGFASETM